MPESAVRVSVEHVADVTVVSILTPRVNADLSESFDEQVVRIVDSLGGPARVLLDFRAVQFLSSAVLGKLIKLNGRVMDRGGELKLCSLSDRIAEIFHLTSLDRLFSIHDSRDDALRAFK